MNPNPTQPSAVEKECSFCHGIGYNDRAEWTCNHCHGSGREVKPSTDKADFQGLEGLDPQSQTWIHPDGSKPSVGKEGWEEKLYQRWKFIDGDGLNFLTPKLISDVRQLLASELAREREEIAKELSELDTWAHGHSPNVPSYGNCRACIRHDALTEAAKKVKGR